MKIIAGERKGHTIRTPEGQDTRPTLSRVREALFSIIAGDIPEAIFCELFAGSGAIGLEALSRGAGHAIMVEQARAAFGCLQENVARLRYTDKSTLIKDNVYRWAMPTGAQAPDIIFADPPYEEAEISRFMKRLEQWELKEDALVIVQTSALYKPESSFQHLRTATYGNTALHFYLVERQSASADSADQPSTVSR